MREANFASGIPGPKVGERRKKVFAEVKSSKVRLSEDHKRWIRDNAATLRLPFRLIKVIRHAAKGGM